jgi:hypothetical protein
MKRFLIYWMCLMLIPMISCQKDEDKPVRKKGTLHIDVGLDIQVNELHNLLKSTNQTENFMVTIYRADGTEVMVFENAIEIPEAIELETGDYYVEAHSENNLPAAFENPYYFGASDPFTIISNTQETVVVTCQLANTMVSVEYSASVTGSFTDYRTTVSSTAGSLLFGPGETRFGYFQTLPLEILVELTYLKPDGTTGNKTLTGSIPAPLANRRYEIKVDASISEGVAAFQILLDESVVQVEIVQINDDGYTPPPGAIGYGDLLITEIMYDPAALSDTEGEWFEIYNNSDHPIQLQNLVLGRDDANRHTIADPIELEPAGYYVFSRTVTATAAANSYSYGTSITLSNTGATLYIFNENSGTGPGAVIFSVNYGNPGFPDGSGASIQLDPGSLDPAQAVLGTSWCAASTAYSTGDLGTPGTANVTCQ